ncbi:uncharacterized protein LOC144411793 [Styela clava]
MVVPVKVSANDSDCYSFTYAFLDYGSSRSFCTTDLAKSLGFQGETEGCTIHTASGSKPHSGKRVSFTITGINEPNEICINNILTFDGIPDLRDSIPHQEIVEQYPHLHGLSFPEVNGTIKVLIGSDVLGQFPISDTCVGEQGSPTAYHTMLGWALAGPDKNAQISNCVDVNFLKAGYSYANSIEESTNLSMCHICGHDFVDLYADPCTTEFSVDDKKALSIMADTVKMVNGRYQIALPWVSDNVTLPNNRILAEKRLVYLKRKFLKNPDLFQKYKDKIHAYIQNGYAEYLVIHELPHSNRTSYLPHHYTGQKFRVVFDCSAEFQGTCLNNNLLSGPFNTNTLVGVLLRFRQEPVAVICDICQMFHRIRVNPPDCDSMQFLWWPNDDLSRDPVELKMLSHIFGCKSSPSVATFALRKVADHNLSNADSVTIETVNRNFFVDDCLKSLPTADQTVSLISQLRKLLDTCGFHLAKFISNDQAVLDSIPDEDKAPSMVDFDIQGDSSNKTLGVHWRIDADKFVIRINVEPRPLTRRGILSMVSQVFDPLGFVQPFIFPAKPILRELCDKGYCWDDNISGPPRESWENWIAILSNLNYLSIPRCFKPADFTPTEVQLHLFCDASRVGYGCSSYLRMIDAANNIHVVFVRGVSRVTPKQPITIPRLEVVSAVAAAELARSIVKELDYKIDKVLYSDTHIHTHCT